MWVKICGITNPDDARAAWDAGADAIGLNFVSGPRKITLSQAVAILDTVPTAKAAVALVEYGVKGLSPAPAAWLTGHDVRDLQLYGDVTPERLAVLLADGWRPFVVCRAPRGRLAESIAPWIEPGSGMTATYLLIDAYAPGSKGGSGITADWSEVAALRQEPTWPDGRRLILAGGLTAGNVARAIEIVHPWGVDVSSGVESEPGKKDADKMAAFVAAARSAS